MSPSYGNSRGGRRYFYYKCQCKAHYGKPECRKSVRADDLENLIVSHIARIAP